MDDLLAPGEDESCAETAEHLELDADAEKGAIEPRDGEPGLEAPEHLGLTPPD